MKPLSATFQRWLGAVIAAAFLAALLFSFLQQSALARRNAENLLLLNIRDVRADIVDASDENLIGIAYAARDRLHTASADALAALAEEYGLAEINLVGADGIIVASTYPDFVGYDMRAGEQSAAFLPLLTGELEAIVQPYGPVSYDPSIARKYAAVYLEAGGFLQVGYDADRFQADIASETVGSTRNRHIGTGGCIIMADAAGRIVSDRHGHEGEDFTAVTGLSEETLPERSLFRAKLHGIPSFCVFAQTEGYAVLGSLPVKEAMYLRNTSVGVTAALGVLLFAAVFFLVYYLVRRLVVRNMEDINADLSAITAGDLDVAVDVRASTEFSSLSDGINATVDTLKRYIAEAETRIDQELEYAKAIQLAALPREFPAFPERKEFDLYALMRAAREVGGDFYDFYLLGEERLVFLIADVSGKGIPAALFMMRAKTLLKSLMERGLEVHEALEEANARLAEGNESGMFVTAWLAALHLPSGEVIYANAGHNPPALRKADGSFAFLRGRAGFVLGGMEGMRYARHGFQMSPGDTLYLYTDGVTEAVDPSLALYGNARLLAALDAHAEAEAELLCRAVLEDVDAYAGEAPQFDDITMLALRYHGAEAPEAELLLRPALEEIPGATAFVEERLQEAGAPMKAIARVNVALDELLSNIARHSGASRCALRVRALPGRVRITCIDDGVPFDPTALPAPALSGTAEERALGGLGIHMVRRTMDGFSYARTGDENHLTIEKTWEVSI